MTAASFDHAFFEGRRPRGHAKPEIRIRLGARQCARAVTIAFRRILHNIVLIGGDRLTLFPYRRAHGAVGAYRVVGPISARVGKIEPTGKCAGDDPEAEFAGEELRMALDPLEVARPTVEQ